DTAEPLCLVELATPEEGLRQLAPMSGQVELMDRIVGVFAGNRLERDDGSAEQVLGLGPAEQVTQRSEAVGKVHTVSGLLGGLPEQPLHQVDGFSVGPFRFGAPA